MSDKAMSETRLTDTPETDAAISEYQSGQKLSNSIVAKCRDLERRLVAAEKALVVTGVTLGEVIERAEKAEAALSARSPAKLEGAVEWPDNRCPQCGTVHPLLVNASPASAMREACAKLCEELSRNHCSTGYAAERIRALPLPSPEPVSAAPRAHQWDDAGERCVVCGDKDWMGGTCSGPTPAAAKVGEA